MIGLITQAWAGEGCGSTLGLRADRLAACEQVGVRLGAEGGGGLGRYDASGGLTPDPGEGRLGGELRVVARLAPYVQVGAELAAGAAFDGQAREAWTGQPQAWLRVELPDPASGATPPLAAQVALVTPTSRFEWTWLAPSADLGWDLGPLSLGAEGGVEVPLVGETSGIFRPGLRWSGGGEAVAAAGQRAQVGLDGGVRGALPGTADGVVAGVVSYAPWVGAELVAEPADGWRVDVRVQVDPPIARWGWNRDAWWLVGVGVMRGW